MVNGAAGQERNFDAASMPKGERIAVIGAGPAGLDLRLAGGRAERGHRVRAGHRPGGAFRYAGKAPLFQEVVANQDSFDRTIAQHVAACTQKGVTFAMAPTLPRTPDRSRLSTAS